MINLHPFYAEQQHLYELNLHKKYTSYIKINETNRFEANFESAVDKSAESSNPSERFSGLNDTRNCCIN